MASGKHEPGKHEAGGRMPKLLYGLIGLLALCFLGAAKGCDSTQSPPPEAPNPTVMNPGQPQPDPGNCQQNCDEEQYAEFHAVWKSQSKPTPRIEYTLAAGAAPIPATNLKVSKATDGYILVWVKDVKVTPGQTIGFTLFGTPGTFHVECMIVHKGQFHSVQTSDRNCASSYTAT